ncbi:lactadherin-like isoform X2 [Lytechinus variegatus]|uniref:lactadherin-like isoform X2 n=1 Tax=Lytechinus variegatus TaxID=7654 RepID=UPI001BB28969|nr:lactadherin-like isoform X2 [Lytechinus variegatus]
MEKNRLSSFLMLIVTTMSVMLVLCASTEAQLESLTFCEDGYKLNYTLPMLKQCEMKENAEKDGLIQTIPKLIPTPSIDSGCSLRQNLSGIPQGQRVCKVPVSELSVCSSNPCRHGGTCEETDKGFSCICPESYSGQTCEHGEDNPFIKSVKLVGGEGSHDGMVAFSPFSNLGISNTYILIHLAGWNSNASRLVCQHLGFKGVYLTLTGSHFNVSYIMDDLTQSANVDCPDTASDISDCSWYNETQNYKIELSIGVVCCSESLFCRESGDPVGLENGFIPDSAITGSSSYRGKEPFLGRLHSSHAWVPRREDSTPWIQVHFNSSYLITGFITQGNVDLFRVGSSDDGVAWTLYMDVNSAAEKTFQRSVNYQPTIFRRPVLCRFFRIYPINNFYSPSLTFELIGHGPLNYDVAALNQVTGCPSPIHGEPLGIQDGSIPDTSITRSCSGIMPKATIGRLHRSDEMNLSGQCDTASDDIDYFDNWVKIDLGELSTITGIITQGSSSYSRWITSLFISYSIDDAAWIFVLEQECGSPKVFTANYNMHSDVTTLLPRPISARYVKIHPVTYYAIPSMRFELLGVKHT